MRKMVVVPEDVYQGLVSASQPSDPFHNEIQNRKRRINQILNDSNQPADIRSGFYNDEVKRLQQVRTTLPEVAIERNELPDAVTSNGNPVIETARDVPSPPPKKSKSPEKTKKSKKSSETKDNHQSPPKKTKKSKKSPETKDNDQSPPKQSRKSKKGEKMSDLVASVRTRMEDLNKQLDKAKPINIKPADNLKTAIYPTPMEEKIAQITQILLDDRTHLPFNEQGNILKEGKPITGSSLNRNIRYVLQGRTSAGVPKGYNEFWSAMEKRPELSALFEKKFYQRGAGSFKFVPKLWSKF